MDLDQVRELLNAVSVTYQNAYQWMSEQAKLTLIHEVHDSLKRYDYDVCVRAWRKYKEFTIREFNIGMFIGVVKDIQEQEEKRREVAKALQAPGKPVKDKAYWDAKEECGRKCQKIWGWSEEYFERWMAGFAEGEENEKKYLGWHRRK